VGRDAPYRHVPIPGFDEQNTCGVENRPAHVLFAAFAWLDDYTLSRYITPTALSASQARHRGTRNRLTVSGFFGYELSSLLAILGPGEPQ
jgi:hypothetical protein